MIEFLIWAFTDRLERVIWVNITDVIPSDAECSEIHKNFEKKFNCRAIITFDRSERGNSIKSFYIKKR